MISYAMGYENFSESSYHWIKKKQHKKHESYLLYLRFLFLKITEYSNDTFHWMPFKALFETHKTILGKFGEKLKKKTFRMA